MSRVQIWAGMTSVCSEGPHRSDRSQPGLVDKRSTPTASVLRDTTFDLNASHRTAVATPSGLSVRRDSDTLVPDAAIADPVARRVHHHVAYIVTVD